MWPGLYGNLTNGQPLQTGPGMPTDIPLRRECYVPLLRSSGAEKWSPPTSLSLQLRLIECG